jgi:hypothetical protein
MNSPRAHGDFGLREGPRRQTIPAGGHCFCKTARERYLENRPASPLNTQPMFSASSWISRSDLASLGPARSLGANAVKYSHLYPPGSCPGADRSGSSASRDQRPLRTASAGLRAADGRRASFPDIEGESEIGWTWLKSSVEIFLQQPSNRWTRWLLVERSARLRAAEAQARPLRPNAGGP